MTSDTRPRRLLFIAILMWVTPAVLAGMFGWPGIWGGGSAFSDLIVPAPITGGIFHVPSYVLALLLMSAYRNASETNAALLRTVFLAAFLVGLLQLIDLERLYVAITSDMERSALRMHENYLGICLASDALLGWIWMKFDARGEVKQITFASILLLPAVAYVALALFGNDRVGAEFLQGRSEQQPQRGDVILWIYTTHQSPTPEVQMAALDLVWQRLPDQNANYQDMALFFTNSMQDAKGYAPEAQPLFSACVYEDGTETVWQMGRADCFSHHENFSERLNRTFDELPQELPRDIKHYMVAEILCKDFVVTDNKLDIEEQSYCRRVDLTTKKTELIEKHGEEAFLAATAT